MNTDCQHIIFSDEAYNAIMTETAKMSPDETGGILLGHILDNGVWIVMEVLAPGWRSVFQYAYFEYDEQFVNYMAQNESKKYKQELSLLGLWHRHPGSMDTFSSTDNGTNRSFASLHPKGAISGLVNIDPRFRLTMYHCSNPLRYTKVDVEVGDDLIPEDYFKWRYYDGKERNPYLPEKKNESTNTEREYEIGSEKIGQSNTNIRKGGIVSFLDSKNIFFLLFIVLLTLSLNNQWLHNKVGRANAIEVTYRLDPGNRLIDSVRNEAIKREKNTKPNSLRKANVKAAVGNFITTYKVKDKGQTKLTGIDRFVTCLWIFTVLSLLIAFFLRKRALFIGLFGQKTEARYWFEKYPKLYEREEEEIKKRFRNVEKTFEGGILSYFIPTDKRIDEQEDCLSFQLVYAVDYAKSKEIKIYFVTPDLNEMLGAKINDFPYVERDGAGEYYLDFSGSLSKKEISGIEIIRKLYAWLRQYERWQKREIMINEFKL